ncbi:hypothetical protein [Pseudomonas sp. dw_358]|uniref:hypothetical protein n=1 Tax=Pseudomonas sp. dw_358 TaxID=2720083 RepID=UPI001BD6BB7F|nr:hypothetical protein [Pseudomonas sp. dw_358]
MDMNIKSFVATVEVVTPGFESVVACMPKMVVPTGGGWLVRSTDSGPFLALRFDFLKHEAERDFFTITAGSGIYVGSRLGVSRNGYLGFYTPGDVADPLKVEWVGAAGSGRFIWRDHRGYRVGAADEQETRRWGGRHTAAEDLLPPIHRYLCVESGTPLEFQANVLSITTI